MTESGHILVADDEDTVLRTTAALLAEEGFVCDMARDANEVRECLKTGNYDLLITDWKMPGNIDLELVRTLRNSKQEIPIIIITGYPQLSQAIQAQGLSIFAEVLKPFEFEDLLEVVQQGVEAGRTHRIST
jgi:DNA-binding NtrC family response regulator